MKNIIIKSLSILALLISFSCEDYLDKAPESTLTEEEVFEDFDHAQGFAEEMYALVTDYALGGHWMTDYIYGDDAICNTQWLASRNIDRGNLRIANNYNFTYLNGGPRRQQDPSHQVPMQRTGVYDGSLKGIRKANLLIENIDKMVDATQAEKDVILGQAYFFRAFFHFEIMKFWGRFPYIDRVLADDYKLPRPETYKESALAANEDFKRAAELLPVDWDEEPYGQKTLGNNKGRLTKGAAYAFQGKNLLFAASPLMKGSENTYDYDTELAGMAVDAFAEVLKLDDQGVYDLVPFDRYEEVFWKVPSNNVWPGSTEFIFNGQAGAPWFSKRMSLIAMDRKVSGGSAVLMSPTHNFIHNNFGMANGLSIEDDLSGEYGGGMYDPTEPFENRDPRFYKWIIIDGEKLSDKQLSGWRAKHMEAQLHVGGAHRGGNTGSQTGYFYEKFYPEYATKWDQGRFGQAQPWRIRMRLTDVYLMYAEALHAATGSATTTPDSYNLSAEDVVNIMRDRAGIPHVHPSIVGDANKFMDELRRERSMELSFEGHRWVDIRRWVLAHKPEYKTKTALEFPEDHSSFKEVEILERVCEYPKHYWLPFPTDETRLYEGFPQNPGW